MFQNENGQKCKCSQFKYGPKCCICTMFQNENGQKCKCSQFKYGPKCCIVSMFQNENGQKCKCSQFKYGQNAVFALCSKMKMAKNANVCNSNMAQMVYLHYVPK